ncbi:MAG TPA: hypothetical protein VMI54_28790 [Polyangiaceae bacterium]|nr:hypothetical protein [Polyangiaceae bacterium]
MSAARREAAGALGAVLASIALTLAVVRLSAPPRQRPPAPPAPLAFSDSAARCETCHPRESAEWRRSVIAHASRSPLFQALELLIEEEVGRSNECPLGAGILRRRDPATECRDATTGLPITGAGGEGWCVNCHAPGVNLGGRLPTWDARARRGDDAPLGELLGGAAADGIGCTFCHQVRGPAHLGVGSSYEGNATWSSLATGNTFSARPTAHDRAFSIGNSGYGLARDTLLPGADDGAPLVAGGAHRALAPEQRAYLRSSEFCGSCHDVRLFGTDVLGSARGEHFKRLRNAYSEWLDYARARSARGLTAPTCQNCHASSFPGVCAADEAGTRAGATPSSTALERACPPGTHFEPRDPGAVSLGFAAAALGDERPLHAHDFTGVELPLTRDFEPELAGERALDDAGRPLGVRARRDLLLASSVRLSLGAIARQNGSWQIPVTVENVGAGHRVPAGFSQERELWVELSVRDERGRLLYSVGHVERPDADLADKRFLRVTTDPDAVDANGRPVGLFGADVSDGPDVPRWEPPPDLGGRLFRGSGLVNFQNGFLRCVSCIDGIDANGRCVASPERSDRSRAARFTDGDYDPDTGVCRSNLSGRAALFETYFPVGALDASRGVIKAPDAIIDTRSLAPATPVTYVYELALPSSRVAVTARLLFRAFPPYLIRAFAAYEAAMAARGARPGGPLVTEAALDRLEIVELARAEGHGG